MSKNVWDGADQSAIEWDDWVSVPSYQTIGDYDVWLDSQNFTRSNVIEFKSDRIAYYVPYYSNGQVVASNRQIFGSTVDTSAAVVPEAPEGVEFAGWYTDSDFSGDPVTSLTMPIGGTSLYAKWIHPAVYVTFDSAGGSAVDVQKVSWGDKATRPADPTRAGYKFGGWYYVGAGSDTPAPFSFDLGLEGDVNLIAAWSSTNTPTTYTVIHKAADGTVLYQETLSGTVGQTVTALELAQDDAHRQGLAYASASGKTIDLAADASQNVIEFTYSRDASHPYVVHLWDEETGLPIAADAEFDSVEALLNYAAPTLSGYHVLNGGQGYLSTRDDGQELTFWYAKDSTPVTPDANDNSNTSNQSGEVGQSGKSSQASEQTSVQAASSAMAETLPRMGDTSAPALTPVGW